MEKIESTEKLVPTTKCHDPRGLTMILITLIGSHKLKEHGRKIVSVCKHYAGNPMGRHPT